MKTHKLPLVFGIICLVWIGMAIHRWWFTYPDTSQLVLALILGIIGLGGSYVYNWMKEKDIRDNSQDKRIDAIVMWWTNQEKDQVRDIAMGEKDE